MRIVLILAALFALLHSFSSQLFAADAANHTCQENHTADASCVASATRPAPPPPLKADAKKPDGQFIMATQYFNKQNYGDALKWFQEAANGGHAQAATALAGMYRDGIGTPRDAKKAFHWWKVSADRDFRHGQYMLGNAYHEGIGVVRDDHMAVLWWNKSVEKEVANDMDVHDVSEALHKLADAYRNGEGVVKDEQLADELLQRAKPLDEEAQYCCSRSWQSGSSGLQVFR